MTNKALVEALLPCPFCGGEALLENTITQASVMCCDCPAVVRRDHSTRSFDDGTHRAIAAWNVRTALAPSPGEDRAWVERLRATAASLVGDYDGEWDGEAYLMNQVADRLTALASSGNATGDDKGLVCNCKDAHGNKPRADCPYCNGTNIIADSPGLDGYEPKRKVGASGYGWLVGAIDPNATEVEKLRLELYCMNERRKTQVAQTRYHRERADALEPELTALSSGNEVAKVVGWLLSLDRDEWYPSDVADALVRGDHLASDAAPRTGG